MTDEMKQLMKSTLLDYLNKESVIQDEVEFDVDKVQDEVFEFWENDVLNEFGLNNSTEDEKREFLKTYLEDCNNSLLEEEEHYFEPDISLEAEELLKEILNSKSPTIDFYKLLRFIENQKFKKQIKTAKIKLNFSPTNFKKLLVKFFEKKGVIVDDDKDNRITCFIANCFFWNKKYHFKNKGNETINFLDRKSLMPLISLIIFLNKIDKKIEFRSTTAFANLLNDELKQNNPKNIGLSNNLRNEITKHLLNKNIIELCILAGFKKNSEIKDIISN